MGLRQAQDPKGLRQLLEEGKDDLAVKLQMAQRAAPVVSFDGSKTVTSAAAAPGAAAAAAPGLGAGLSAAGAIVPGAPGQALTGAGAGASLGSLLGVSGPVGAGVGAGLALIQGLLGSAAKKRRERHMAEANKQQKQGEIIGAASDARSRTLRSLL